MTALAAARRLAKYWPPQATMSPATGLPVCIETVRHLVTAFGRCGVKDVRPWPCELHAWNRAASATVLGGDAVTMPGAQKVEISPEASARAGHDGRGWHGHLVLDHPDFILDLVLPAVFASTAATGFERIGPQCFEKHNEILDRDGAWMAMTEDGVCIRFVHRPELAGWRNSAAWRGEQDPQVLDALVEFLRPLVADAS